MIAKTAYQEYEGMDITFDNNAIIDLEENRPDAEYLRAIRDEYHRPGYVTISIGRSIFLEGRPKNTLETDAEFFDKKIAAAGLNIERVQLRRAGEHMAYYCLECNAITYGAEYDIGYHQLIHRIVTGDKDFDFTYYPYRQRRNDLPEEKARQKWFNHKLDIGGLVEHVAWGGDIFVTRDKGILNKRDALAQVVPGKILNPKETLEELRQLSFPLPEKPHGWSQPRLAIAQCIHCRIKKLIAEQDGQV
jgi:hypothetical protein